MPYNQTLAKIKKRIEEQQALLDAASISQPLDPKLAELKGLSFYCEWSSLSQLQTQTNSKYCCFNHAIGLPLGRDGNPCPLWPWQKEYLFDPIMNFKYNWIKKAAGIGCSEIALRVIAWRCLVNDDWQNANVCIVTGPNERLAIRLVEERLKPLFYNLGVTFNSEKKVLILNKCHIEAYASNHIDSMRSLVNVKFIFLDEADFWIHTDVHEARRVAERYIGKSDTSILLASTPGAPGSLFEQMENEKQGIYNKIYMHYSIGLGSIFDPAIIEIAKQSPSFDQEYELKYGGSLGTIFNQVDIRTITTDPYDLSDEVCKAQGISKWLMLDAGWGGSSDFGIVIIDWRDQKLNVIYENALKSPLMDDVRHLIHQLVQEYHICRVYSDGSSVVLNNQLQKNYGETINWQLLDQKTQDQLLLGTECRRPLINPVNFRSKGRYMLEKLHHVVSSHQIRIDPIKFPKTVLSLKTAVNKVGDLWSLDKEATSHDDILDALRMGMLCLRK